MSERFSIVVADCPWSFSDKLQMSDVARAAAANYRTMTISDIKALPIKELADPTGAILALWVPSSLLQEGLDVMKAWDFQQKQSYIWAKTKKEPKDISNSLSFGMGRLFRNCHEICLIGINNNGIYKKLKNKSQRTVCLAPNFKHSKKPEDLQDSLELMFPGAASKIELFARRERQGWLTLGNEVGDRLDIRDSIAKLI